MATRTTGRYALIADLNEDWARLVGQHRGRLPWGGELAGYDDLAQLIAAIRHRPDPLLGALLRESAAGDLLAARTVLQAMLGKVVRLSQGCRDTEVSEFVTALWCRIRTYPLARRPASIAANLALDTRKDVLAQRRLERAAAAAVARDEDALFRRLAGGAPGVVVEEARTLIETAERHGLLDEITAATLRLVYLDGASGRVAAARLGTSAGMVRYRCSRGVRVLARHADDLSPLRIDDVA